MQTAGSRGQEEPEPHPAGPPGASAGRERAPCSLGGRRQGKGRRQNPCGGRRPVTSDTRGAASACVRPEAQGSWLLCAESPGPASSDPGSGPGSPGQGASPGSPAPSTGPGKVEGGQELGSWTRKGALPHPCPRTVVPLGLTHSFVNSQAPSGSGGCGPALSQPGQAGTRAPCPSAAQPGALLPGSPTPDTHQCRARSLGVS